MKASHIINRNSIESILVTGRIVEQFLSEYCHNKSSKINVPPNILDDCLSDIGLRLRPFLLRISYESDIRSFNEILPVAAGIELIQLSTLMIDDILDDSLIRNGKPSIFRKCGTKKALIYGTIMASMGISLVTETLIKNNTLKNRLVVLKLLTDTHINIYSGQSMDLDLEGDVNISEQQYYEIISKTTACFILAPLVAGAMLWDAPSVLVSQLESVGYSLGMAYQIRDDVVDLLGDPELTGKPKALDLHERKMRLPVIHALRCLSSKERNRIVELLERHGDLTVTEVEEETMLLEQAGSIEYAINKAKEYCLKADEVVDTLASEFEHLKGHLRSVSKLISCFGDEWD